MWPRPERRCHQGAAGTARGCSPPSILPRVRMGRPAGPPTRSCCGRHRPGGWPWRGRRRPRGGRAS
eukprot:12760647-Alexandrium_andersonii.AAC.1